MFVKLYLHYIQQTITSDTIVSYVHHPLFTTIISVSVMSTCLLLHVSLISVSLPGTGSQTSCLPILYLLYFIVATD